MSNVTIEIDSVSYHRDLIDAIHAARELVIQRASASTGYSLVIESIAAAAMQEMCEAIQDGGNNYPISVSYKADSAKLVLGAVFEALGGPDAVVDSGSRFIPAITRLMRTI